MRSARQAGKGDDGGAADDEQRACHLADHPGRIDAHLQTQFGPAIRKRGNRQRFSSCYPYGQTSRKPGYGPVATVKINSKRRGLSFS